MSRLQGATAVPTRLTWLLLRRGWDSPAGTLLPVAAFTAVTALTLTVVAGAWSFWRWDDDLAVAYQMLAGFAVVLLLMPLMALAGSAARLSARRRDQRLSTLRLLGATPWQVRVMSLLESSGLAALGAVAGVLVHLLAGPLVQQVPFRGEPIGAAYWLPVWTLLVAPLAVGLLAAVSAGISLQRVVVSPLGVRTRQPAPALSPVRVAVAVVVLTATFLALRAAGGLGVAVGIGILLGGFAASMAVLNLLGPWVVGVLARWSRRTARSPELLLAAAGTADAPKAVWRQVGAVPLLGFVSVVLGSGAALMIASDGHVSGPERFLPQDIRTGLLITVVVSFLVVACSVAVNAAAEVYDRADLYRSLHKLGMTPRSLQRSRSASVMVPLVWMTVLGTLAGALLAFPLVGMALLSDPVTVLVVLACVVAGVLVVAAALAGTRPVLASVLRP